MARNYSEDDDILSLETEENHNRVPDLDPDAVPDSVGVYDRPQGKTGTGISLAAIVGILILLVIAYFVLTTLF
jgi:hypothetical protein